jgi:hypothetical protein
MGWKEATRLALVGEKKKIEIISADKERWIRPKKLPVEVADEIGELSRSDLRMPENKELIPQYRALIKEMEAEGKVKDGKFAEGLEDDERTEINVKLSMVAPISDKELRNKIFRLYLLHGIGEHNFESDEDGKPVGEGKVFPIQTVDEILEWGPLADEIVGIIKEYNSPLPKGSESTSGKSPSGSSIKSNSQTENRSLTEDAQAS